MKVTRVQRRVLEIAARDCEIVLGGIDATPGVSRVVVRRLAQMGLLRWKALPSFFGEGWTLTDKGRAMVKFK